MDVGVVAGSGLRLRLRPLTASTRLDVRARAKEAKEEKAKENGISADQPGTSRENAPNHTSANAKAKDSKENATSAEKLDIQPANAPRAK